MKRRWTSISMLAVGLLLALAVGMTQAQGSDSGAEPRAESLSIAATVGQKISYQGTLTDDGTPVDGVREMVFKLYSDDGCSTVVDTIDAGSVQVNDGVFDVVLTVNQDDFNGQGLWLEVEVGGTGVGCEELLPVPYALSLRPGAVISDADTSVEVNRLDEGTGFQLDAYYGVYAEADGAGTNYGVRGESFGLGAGVLGVSNSASGWGVQGWNSAGGDAGRFVGDVRVEGDVEQGRDDNGLVKAAAKISCYNLSTVQYSFNNVGDPVTVTGNLTLDGVCTIDFNFDLSDRYWSATATTASALGVTCRPGSSSDTLTCQCWDPDGIRQNGDIVVVVY
ncbi:MAG: hypothetical protein R6X31_15675 [Anaerolineae bacterium]